MRTSNPTLNQNTFTSANATGQTMTIQGTVNKTLILAVLVLAAGYVTYGLLGGNPFSLLLGIVGFVLSLILGIVTAIKPTWSPVTAPLYAVAEGFFLGAISFYLNSQFEGIAGQALSLTVATLIMLLLAYKTGLIPVTANLRLGIVAATGAIAMMYLVTMLLSLFGMNVSFMHDGSWLSIGISLLCVGVAAMNLVLDFDFIEQGAAQNAPKYMEWYGAFALLVTLVWLYIEILKLLSKLRSSR
jgi:uncharacterized YccA/Bax inhibitor family protein